MEREDGLVYAGDPSDYFLDDGSPRFVAVLEKRHDARSSLHWRRK